MAACSASVDICTTASSYHPASERGTSQAQTERSPATVSWSSAIWLPISEAPAPISTGSITMLVISELPSWLSAPARRGDQLHGSAACLHQSLATARHLQSSILQRRTQLAQVRDELCVPHLPE